MACQRMCNLTNANGVIVPEFLCMARYSMNSKTILTLALLTLIFALPAHARPMAADLAGHWESMVEFGKMKFKLTIEVTALANGKVEAKAHIPEQGARDIPVSAMLYNHPSVRWEIDPFNTSFTGKLNEGGTEIIGSFEEGPGGRSLPLVFKRVDPSSQQELEQVYTFKPGEKPDLRGYWEGAVSIRDVKTRMGLKVGRRTDGVFAVELDLLDQGARGLPATLVHYTNSTVKLEWQLFRIVFDGRLSEDGTQLVGEWKSRGTKEPITFTRLQEPATVLPSNVSFVPQNNSPADIRGSWNGTLDVQGQKLRLVVKIGQMPDGGFVSTLASLDQGGTEIPASSAGYTNPVVRLEWKAINGVFKGTLNPEGTLLDGTWEQGPPLELKLARTPLSSGEKKP